MSTQVVQDPAQNQMDSLVLAQFANMLRPQQGVKQNNYDKFRKEYLDVFNKAADATEFIKRLEDMRKLNNRGNMGSPLIASILKRVGIDFPSLFTTDSQNFEKLTTDMTKFAKVSFGSNLSKDVVNIFLKSIPSRTMSKEGRDRVINSLIEFAKPAIERKNILLDIRKDNNGRLPDDFLFELEERVNKKEQKANDKIAQLSEMSPNESDTPGLNQLPEASQAKGYVFQDSSLLDKNGEGAYRYSDGRTWGIMTPEQVAKYIKGEAQEPTLMDKIVKRPSQLRMEKMM